MALNHSRRVGRRGQRLDGLRCASQAGAADAGHEAVQPAGTARFGPRG